MKKVIVKRGTALILILLLLLSVCPTYAGAAYEEPTIYVENMEATAGTAIFIPVYIQNNPGFSGMRLYFDIPSGFSIESYVTTRSGENSVLRDYNEDEDGWNVVGFIQTSNDVDGKGIFVYGNNANRTRDGVICWVKYNVSEDAVNGTYTLSISTDSLNNDEEVMIIDQFDFVPGTITVTGGQEPVAATVEVTPETDTVAVPTKAAVEAGNPTTVQMSAVVKNQIGGVMEGQSVTWGLQDNPEGVSISDSGLVTVDNTAEDGEITVVAKCGSAEGRCQLTLTKETSVVTAIEASDKSVDVPTQGQPNSTVELTAKVFDQYGVPMNDKTVNWTMEGTATGVSLSGDTITVTKDAQEGSVTVTASCEGKTDTATVTIHKAAAVPEAVVIQKGGENVANDSITIPQSGSNDVTYTAVVYDQYGAEMENPAVTWKLTRTGAGVSQTDGTVTVTPGAAAGTYILEADCGGKTAQVAISVAGITFEEVFAEVRDEHVYGMTWAEIITDVSGTATIDGTVINGKFSILDPDVVPDAGDQTYTIVFTGGGYENITAQTGYVNILPKPVTVTGITAQDKPYDGSANADFNVSKARIEGIVGDDSLIVASATGEFEDKNAGNDKPVSISKIILGGKDAGNYTVSQPAGVTATISPKALTITGVGAANKIYDGTTAATATGSAVLNGVAGEDDVTVVPGTAAFTDENAGPQTVTFTGYGIEGADAGNYTVSQPANVTATISRKPVTITGTTAQNKVYDGTTAAKVDQTGDVTTKIDGDDVSVQAGAAQFTSADAGEDIRVIFSGFTLTGADAGNYILSAQPADGMADIAKAVYPGTPVVNIDVMTQQAEALTGSLTASDFFATLPAGAEITAVTPKAANHIMGSVTAAGGEITYTSGVSLPTANLTDTYEVTISTKNYSDIKATLTFTTVDKTPVAVSGVAVADKTYDGKALTYTGTPAAMTGDGKPVADSGFTYTWKDSEGQPLTSAPKNAGSYTLTVAVVDDQYTGSVTLNCSISKAAVTITALDVSAPVGSKLPTFSYRVAGLAEGESLKTEPTLTCAADMNKTGVYAIKASGAEVPEGGNYHDTITYVDGKLTVYYYNTANRVTVYGGAHGIARVDDYNPSTGDRVTITVTPDEGYEVDQVLVTTASGKKVPVTRTGENRYVFEMPGGSVSIQVTYKAEEKVVYTDVSPYAWYAEAVEYVTVQGLMNGVGEGKFAPSATVTRAMVWTVLARMDGENTEGGSTWYSKARTWAMENGVSDGANPEAAITREQLATMLYRYCGSPAVSGSLSGYADGSSVSDWAEDAMLWAIEQGLIEGVGDNKLAPAADTTRAQLAQILMRFDKKF